MCVCVYLHIVFYDFERTGNNVQNYINTISTAISTLLGLISSVYRDFPHWKSNQRPQNAEPKLDH